MKFIKENKNLLLKYLLIIVSNIIIVILSNYYFKNSYYKDLYMLFIIIIFDFIIYFYHGKVKFNYVYDFIVNIIICLSLMFINDKMSYFITMFNVTFSNNIVFMRSRIVDKFWIKTLQYVLIFILAVIEMFICGFIYLCIFHR